MNMVETENLEALKIRYPDLYRQVLAAPPADLDLVTINGHPNIRISGQPCYHADQPLKAEIVRLANTYPGQEICFIVYGAVLPYHIEAFLSRPLFDLFVVEKDIANFRRLLASYPMAPLLRHTHIRFCVSDNPTAIAQTFYAWRMNAAREDAHAFITPTGMDPAFYTALHARLNQVAEQAALDVRIFQEGAPAFFRSTLQNIPKIARSLNLTGLRAFTQNHTPVPILIVDAGPSLDDQLDAVAAFREKGLILCVDSAWPSLNRHGIRADWICTTDDAPIKTQVFESLPADLPVLTVPEAHPERLQGVARVGFLSRGLPFSDYVGSLVGGFPILHSQILDGINFAFHAAQLLLNSRCVCLVGCDLCYSPDGRHHAENRRAPVQDSTLERTRGDGVYGPVETHPMFLSSKSVMEWQVHNRVLAQPHEPWRFFNTSGGLFLNGWTHQPLAQVVAALPASDTLEPLRQVARDLPPVTLKTADSGLQSLPSLIEARQQKLDTLLDLTQQALDAHRHQDLPTYVQCVKAARTPASEVAQNDAAMAAINSLCSTLMPKLIRHDRLIDFATDDNTRIVARLEKSLTLYTDMKEILRWVAAELAVYRP